MLDNANPSNFNLQRENKNETGGKKSDEVIAINGEIIGIVEPEDQKELQPLKAVNTDKKTLS